MALPGLLCGEPQNATISVDVCLEPIPRQRFLWIEQYACIGPSQTRGPPPSNCARQDVAPGISRFRRATTSRTRCSVGQERQSRCGVETASSGGGRSGGRFLPMRSGQGPVAQGSGTLSRGCGLVCRSRVEGNTGATPHQLCSSRCRTGHQQVSPGDYVADTALSGAGAAVSLRGGDGFIGRRPKRRTVSTHAERSRPSRSRIGDTVEGMRPRLPFTS
jgi:hypothetical protein